MRYFKLPTKRKILAAASAAAVLGAAAVAEMKRRVFALAAPVKTTWTRRKMLALGVLGAAAAAAVAAIMMASHVMTPQEIACLSVITIKPSNTFYLRAVILDDDRERACGLRCVDPSTVKAAVFVWRDEIPRIITFTAEGLDRPIYLLHVVRWLAISVYVLRPGEKVTVTPFSGNDFFVEIFADAITGSPIIVMWCTY